MNLLIAGRGPGSWTMRGQQIGRALGARVTSDPSPADWRWAELAIVVKRAVLAHAGAARQFQVPIVWDALDFWRQPAQNHLTEPAARGLLEQAILAVRPLVLPDATLPVAVIGATRAMAAAARGVYLPHHGHLGLVPTPARRACRVVAYDGNPIFLDHWQPALRAMCAARGWVFTINPPDLAEADIVVALRGGVWDGWMCRAWKSGVKVVNAILAGRPLIAQASAAVAELDPEGSIVETPAELDRALDRWADYHERRALAERAVARAPAFSITAVAGAYRAYLEGLRVGAST
jgi:hypothetical protein